MEHVTYHLHYRRGTLSMATKTHSCSPCPTSVRIPGGLFIFAPSRPPVSLSFQKQLTVSLQKQAVYSAKLIQPTSRLTQVSMFWFSLRPS